MEIKTALSKDGEKLYILIGDKDAEADVTALEFTLDGAKEFMGLVYDLIKEAQSTQDLIAMGFDSRGN